MKSASTLLSLAVAGMLFVSCDKKDETPVPVPTVPTPSASGTPTMPKTEAIDKAVDNAKSNMAKNQDVAKENAVKATEAAKDTADKGAAETAKAADATGAEAKKLLDQAMQYIKENKYDLADQTLTKLDAMKANLGPDMQGALANAHKALDTAKKAFGGGNAPAMPAMPGMGK